jgi:probable rRNA maturation factor
MSKVKVSITNDQTQIKVPVGIRMLIRRCCHAVLEYEGYTDSYEVSVSFVDDEQIHQLNLEHRKIDRSTDVLSFPLGENGKYDLDRETGAYLL